MERSKSFNDLTMDVSVALATGGENPITLMNVEPKILDVLTRRPDIVRPDEVVIAGFKHGEGSQPELVVYFGLTEPAAKIQLGRSRALIHWRGEFNRVFADSGLKVGMRYQDLQEGQTLESAARRSAKGARFSLVSRIPEQAR